jgi:hypothetical protein
MYLPAVASSPAPLASPDGGGPGVPVRVMLLGVRVTAYAIVNIAEHRRREAAGIGAVVSPALLDRLMDLPTGIPVSDPVAWAEMADQPGGVAGRHEDGTRVTRRLESPLTITDVVVDAATGRELRAVQDASLFAGFTRRWIAFAAGRMPDAAMLEAKLCGVGIVDQRGGQLLAAEQPAGLTRDGWSWLLEEKTYRRWLTRPAGIRAESQARATGGASGAGAGRLRSP